LRNSETEAGEGEEFEKGWIKRVDNKSESELEMKFFDEIKINYIKRTKIIRKRGLI
jgi:hypothetical protein